MSDKATWSAVDAYIEEQLLGRDAVLDAALATNRDNGLPAIDVSAAQGRFLNLLAKIHGARSILEIGTLGGYSTICLARALPEGGRMVTLEFDPKHAEVARANIERAGLSQVVEVRVGAALESLPGVEAEGLGPFDLVFIDADKRNNRVYLEWALKLSRPGTVVICDNVIRDGRVVDAASADANVGGARAAFEFISGEKRLRGTALQTVGAKGYDGFAIAIVE